MVSILVSILNVNEVFYLIPFNQEFQNILLVVQHSHKYGNCYNFWESRHFCCIQIVTFILHNFLRQPCCDIKALYSIHEEKSRIYYGAFSSLQRQCLTIKLRQMPSLCAKKSPLGKSTLSSLKTRTKRRPTTALVPQMYSQYNTFGQNVSKYSVLQ